MLLVDVSNTKLIPGSDYEDHYKLGEAVSGDKVIGEINLEGIGPRIKDELLRIALEFTEKTSSYTDNSPKHTANISQ